MEVHGLLCLYFMLIQGIYCKPLFPPNDPEGGCPGITDDTAKAHMARFGYVGEVTTNRTAIAARFADQDSYRTALERYQNTLGLPVTGELDLATRCLMATPRCALDDRDIIEQRGRRTKRFVTVGNWPLPADNITWNVLNYTRNSALSNAVIDKIMDTAFREWQKYGNINFTHTPSAPQSSSDIEVGFAVRDHGDGFPFDGPGSVLAHAFFPFPSSGLLAGDIHFDDDEAWTVSDTNTPSTFGTDIVALHEIGHSIGLGHTRVEGAIMFPTYDARENNGTLHCDDVEGVQHLYGARADAPDDPCASTSTSTTRSTSTSTTTPPPIGCRIDAAFEIRSSASYVIQDNHRWRYQLGFRDPTPTDVVVLQEIQDIKAAASDSYVNAGTFSNYLFLISDTYISVYRVYGTSIRRTGLVLDSEEAFRTIISPSAAFMDKCPIRISGRSSIRTCLFVIVRTRFFQYMYTWYRLGNPTGLFQPVVYGDLVDEPLSMPVSDIGARTQSPSINFPSRYATGVDAAIRLEFSIIFFKEDKFIEMGAGQDNIEQNISDRFDCPRGKTGAIAGNNFAISSNSTATAPQVEDGNRRSRTDVLKID